MRELESRLEIADHAEQLLRRADALGRLPTPVDDLVAAAELTEPEESLLAPGVLQSAPTHLREAIARFGDRIQGLVDRRELEVHVSPAVKHEARRNFIRLHETGHHILPWQRELAYGDDDHSLSPVVDEIFELEASQCAADLLFQGSRFGSDAADLAIGMPSVIMSADRYGASLRSALRRYTETHRAAMLSVVLEQSPATRNPLQYRRHEFNASPTLLARFGEQTWPRFLSIERFAFVATAAAAAETAEIVSGEWQLRDLSGVVADLRVDAYSTGYGLLVLAWIPIKERTRKRVRLVA